MRKLLHQFARWLSAKSAPFALTGSQWTGTSYVDAYKRNREPSPNDLMAELKNTAWACASINAAVCASNPPNLYVATHDNEVAPKCKTKALSRIEERRLRHSKHLPVRYRKAKKLEEVLDHPILELFQQVNPVHNQFDLWELTTLYQEVHGAAYWYIPRGPLNIPEAIWILPSQNVTPKRRDDSPNIVDGYVYKTGKREQEFSPDEIIHFRYPNPRDPYLSGLAPLRACYEQVALTSDYAAMKKAIYENRAMPSAIVSPDEAIGEEERARLELQWNQKFRRGGTGRILVGESKLKVDVLQQSMGDLAQLAEIRATFEDICNSFHVPIAYMTTNVNMANLQAAERQHLRNAIHPRVQRRDEKLNEQLLPLYDPSRRLFLATPDPVPPDADAEIKKLNYMMRYGVWTINDVRHDQGYDPVPWGDVSWISSAMWPMTQQRGVEIIQSGSPDKPELGAGSSTGNLAGGGSDGQG